MPKLKSEPVATIPVIHVSMNADKLGDTFFLANIGGSVALFFDYVVEILDAHQWLVALFWGGCSLLLQFYFKRKAYNFYIQKGGRRKNDRQLPDEV